jgi:hypothetical protein
LSLAELAPALRDRFVDAIARSVAATPPASMKAF